MPHSAIALFEAKESAALNRKIWKAMWAFHKRIWKMRAEGKNV